MKQTNMLAFNETNWHKKVGANSINLWGRLHGTYLYIYKFYICIWKCDLPFYYFSSALNEMCEINLQEFLQLDRGFFLKTNLTNKIEFQPITHVLWWLYPL